ncbi:MAG: hypothetical protein Q9165_005369 [Trypethelium subeluteriae]
MNPVPLSDASSKLSDGQRMKPTPEKNSLWYERVGGTYLWAKCYDRSKECFLAAKDLPNCSWRTSQGLAKAYAEDNIRLALQEVEIALATLRTKQDRDDDERASLVENLPISATWQKELGNITDAIHRLKEAVKHDKQYYGSHNDLINLCSRTGRQSEALDFLKELNDQPGSIDISKTELESMFVAFASLDSALDSFETIFRVVQHDDMLEVVLRTLQESLMILQDRKAGDVPTLLHLCHGVVLAHYSTVEKGLEVAVEQWTKCCELGMTSNSRDASWISRKAAVYLFNYHFSKARGISNASDEPQDHASTLVDLTNKINALYKDNDFMYVGVNAGGLRLSLGSFYSLTSSTEKAQKLLLNDMRSGLDLLSDDDPDTDSWGYFIVANVLIHAGDELNALSAWSLRGPKKRYAKERDVPNFPMNARSEDGGETVEEGQTIIAGSHNSGLETAEQENIELAGLNCQGRGRGGFTYGDSIWFCKVCEDVQFDHACLKKVQNGTIERFICSRDHEFLRVPSWIEEL